MRVFRVATVCLSLCSCGWIAAVTRGPTRALGNLLLSDEEEQEIGSQLAQQLQSQERLVDDVQVQECVDWIGGLLVAQTEEDWRFPYEFTVVEGPETVNAFAIPGGHIYVYTGLIAAADSEAELASVLGHEIGHVDAGHVSDQLAAQVGVNALSSIALGSNPGLVTELASAIATQGYLAAYSRDAEREADEIGLFLVRSANYAPEAMATFFDKLERFHGSNPDVVQEFFATHPAPGDRAKRLRKEIREEGIEGGNESVVGCFDDMKARIGGPARSPAANVGPPR